MPSRVLRDQLMLNKLCRLAENAFTGRSMHIKQNPGSKSGGLHLLKWTQPPRNVLLVMKPNDANTARAALSVIDHFRTHYPEVRLFAETQAAMELHDPTLLPVPSESDASLSDHIDAAVCLGGDGTALHFSSLCRGGPVPPLMDIPIVTPLTALADFKRALDDTMHSRSPVILRMRLQCSIASGDVIAVNSVSESGLHALNEICLHRGRSLHMTAIETRVDGQLLTEAVADGLIVSTPTGSTAYSLSAGGPIVHPSVQSLVLTPISPRSLSFRPVLLPPDVCIQLMVRETSRSPAEISIDGREARLLETGQSAFISMSPYPLPCFVPMPRTAGVSNHCSSLSNDWVEDINAMLSFNRTFAKRRLWTGTDSA